MLKLKNKEFSKL
jgi:hypothetical protein